MKKSAVMVMFMGTLVALGMMIPGKSYGEISINVTIPLPGLVISAPPAMVVIPGTYVYYPPDVAVDIFFYRGYWYRPYQGRWYVSLEYGGPWGHISLDRVPPALVNLPPAFRDVPSRYGPMPYRMVRRNWRTWEEERRWDDSGGGRDHAYPRGGYYMPQHMHGMGRGMGMGTEADD